MRKKYSDQLQIQGAAVLHLRSKRASSRSTLAKVLKVSPSTAGLYVDQLISNGYMEDSELEKIGMGRPRKKLSLRPEAGWFGGVELNAERIQTVRIDFSGIVRASRMDHLPPDADVTVVLKLITSALTQLGGKEHGPLLGVGVGAPGVVDPSSGTGVHYSFIQDWDQVPIAEKLQSVFQVPVTLENNMRVIALAERWFGGGRDLQDFIVLGPRSGFGIAMVQAGKLVEGSTHAAGEIGRWPWPLNGNGADQQIQDALSAPAIYRRLAGQSKGGRLPADLQSALVEKSTATGKEWEGVIEDYARLIGMLHLLMDSKCYFLHGPITGLGERFCREVVEIAPQIFPALQDLPIQLIPSLLGDDAGALGAASLAMEAWLPN